MLVYQSRDCFLKLNVCVNLSCTFAYMLSLVYFIEESCFLTNDLRVLSRVVDFLKINSDRHNARHCIFDRRQSESDVTNEIWCI